MARINLRPWREERNAARQKQFITNLLLTVIMAGAVSFGISYYFDVQMDRQHARNNYLKAEIAKLDEKIKEIKELERQRERLLERLNAIQELQGNRPLVVRYFDELVRVLPDKLYYSSVSRKGESVTVNGIADQNKDVSNLMRGMNSSIWFGEPNLSQVRSAGEVRQFNLNVPLTKPKDDGGQQ
ncbi:PilN domain-containing protein [Marinobacterium rhizophilum]|uniref:PilN domain-containing protein n=1 Tax=Marinobacterium rhizophilum TaxID=420402 RepID=UPI00038117A3|nr:PilN domain-containing protein [Marinobacterium rhizophilum]